jgi:hypothetical protein
MRLMHLIIYSEELKNSSRNRVEILQELDKL